LAAAFGDRLQRAGLPMSVDRLGRFVRAVAVARPATLVDMYWIARVTLVSARPDLDMFDRVFAEVFGGTGDPADFRGDGPTPTATGRAEHVDRRGPQTSPAESLPRTGHEPGVAGDGQAGDDETPERDAVLAAASREERLATTDFAALDEDELRQLYLLMRRVQVVVPPRAGRRQRRHRRGDRADLRATLRRSRRTGGEPFEHVTRRARPRPRKLVVLCDISGSMAPYSRAFVQFLHAAAGGTKAEVFTFATRLTRVTRALAVTQPDAALARAAAAAPDWRGGTRIGDSVKDFLDRYGRRGMAHGAVVVVVSDGWDRSEPVRLAEQMERLARLAHRIVWINPRRAARGFEPLTGGMAAALPFCDALVSGHTLGALREAMTALADPC
jgi:uncharacterized protein